MEDKVQQDLTKHVLGKLLDVPNSSWSFDEIIDFYENHLPTIIKHTLSAVSGSFSDNRNFEQLNNEYTEFTTGQSINNKYSQINNIAMLNKIQVYQEKYEMCLDLLKGYNVKSLTGTVEEKSLAKKEISGLETEIEEIEKKIQVILANAISDTDLTDVKKEVENLKSEKSDEKKKESNKKIIEILQRIGIGVASIGIGATAKFVLSYFGITSDFVDEVIKSMNN